MDRDEFIRAYLSVNLSAYTDFIVYDLNPEPARQFDIIFYRYMPDHKMTMPHETLRQYLKLLDDNNFYVFDFAHLDEIKSFGLEMPKLEAIKVCEFAVEVNRYVLKDYDLAKECC